MQLLGICNYYIYTIIVYIHLQMVYMTGLCKREHQIILHLVQKLDNPLRPHPGYGNRQTAFQLVFLFKEIHPEFRNGFLGVLFCSNWGEQSWG